MATYPLHHDDAQTGDERGHEHDHENGGEHGSDSDQHADDESDHRLQDDQTLQRVLEGTDWEDLTKRLIAYARYRLTRVISARRSGEAPEDYAQNAITLLLAGKRRFPASSDISPFSFLCGVVDSLVSHDAEKVRRRIKGGAAEVPIGADDGEDAHGDQVTEDQLGGVSFEPEVMTRDRFERFVSELEPRLAAYTRLLAGGLQSTAKEYALALGTTEKNVRNMNRQLSRKRVRYEQPWKRGAATSRKTTSALGEAMGT